MIVEPIISSSSRLMCPPTVELSRPLESEATKLTFTICAVSLETFRAVTLVGTWSVGAVGVDVARFILSLAFVDIWNSDGPTNGHICSEELCGECMYLAVYDCMIGCRMVTFATSFPGVPLWACALIAFGCHVRYANLVFIAGIAGARILQP